mgnify:CR=1 FL=1
MFDINFFESSKNIKTNIVHRKLNLNDAKDIEKTLESLRNKYPHIFNIETTNYCNMTCVMCPRTIYMKRKNIWINDDMFDECIKKIRPYKNERLEKFYEWLKENTDFKKDEKSENGFYFSIISNHLVLHGYGEPFLDKFLIKRIEACKKLEIPTYFSCTPATMTIEKAVKAMESGLGVLKFSIDALNDNDFKKIRGKKANYTDSVEKILKLIEIKRERNLKTLLVPCMISFGQSDEDKKKEEEFLNFWSDKDVYAYVKSLDNKWLDNEKNKNVKNFSHYEKQYCEYPWTSLTIMADGNVVPCTQISNNEIVLGNVKENTLEEIWNGKKYKDFRQMHIDGKFPKGHKCKEKCDQKKIYQYLS